MTNIENSSSVKIETTQQNVYGPAMSTGNNIIEVSQQNVYGPAVTDDRNIPQQILYGPAVTDNRTVASSNNIRGINAAGISVIKQAIQSFIKGYQTKVASVGITTANIQQGIKGTSSEKQVENLYNAIKNNVTQSLSKLNTFAEQLDTVKSSYQKADSSNTTVSTYINKIQGK